MFLIGSLSIVWTGDSDSTVTAALSAPIALQEMVLAVWLIVKGFDKAALARPSEVSALA